MEQLDLQENKAKDMHRAHMQESKDAFFLGCE